MPAALSHSSFSSREVARTECSARSVCYVGTIVITGSPQERKIHTDSNSIRNIYVLDYFSYFSIILGGHRIILACFGRLSISRHHRRQKPRRCGNDDVATTKRGTLPINTPNKFGINTRKMYCIVWDCNI